MAKEQVEGQSEGVGSSEGGKKKERKPRATSKYVLCREIEKGDVGSRFEVVSSGTKVSQLIEDACGMEDGRYSVMNVRTVLEVKTPDPKEVKKVVRKVK